MLSVLINWLYMAVLTYLTGSLCLFAFGIKQGVFHRIFTGILFVTCYAQVFSLFAPLSLHANIGLLGVALLSVALCRKSLVTPLCDIHLNSEKSLSERIEKTNAGEQRFLTKKTLTVFFAVIFIILFALCTAGPARQYDTNYYHAQTIHWLEEYGAVKGVANLFYPLANNSAGHYFDAIFSMKFLAGRSLHTTGGFFGLLIFLHGLKNFVCERTVLLFGNRHRRRVTDDENGQESGMQRTALLMYTGMAVAEMVYAVIMTAYYADPYTDILPNVLVLFVVSEWVIGIFKKEDDIKTGLLLSVLALFAAICKLTVWPIALLMFISLIQILKKGNGKYLICFLGAALFTVLPTFATNAVISGYILYPVYFLDFLNVPWKLDVGVLKWNVSSAVEYARLRTTDLFQPLNTGLSWIPSWVARQATAHQLLYAFVLILCGTDVVCFVRKSIQKTLSDVDTQMAALRAVCYVTLVYWFFTMPEIRFVWSFIFVVLVTVPASLENTSKKKIPLFLRCAGLGFFLLLVYLDGIRTIDYARVGFQNAMVMQGDYERREGVTREINGQVFVTEITGEPYVCGYYLFPYFENYTQDTPLVMGDSIRDGFYFNK